MFWSVISANLELVGKRMKGVQMKDRIQKKELDTLKTDDLKRENKNDDKERKMSRDPEMQGSDRTKVRMCSPQLLASETV